MRPEKILCIGTTFVLGGLELRLGANTQRFISTTETVQLARDSNLFKSAQLGKLLMELRGGRVKPESQALYCRDVRKRQIGLGLKQCGLQRLRTSYRLASRAVEFALD
jgi:hypothetical protein